MSEVKQIPGEERGDVADEAAEAAVTEIKMLLVKRDYLIIIVRLEYEWVSAVIS